MGNNSKCVELKHVLSKKQYKYVQSITDPYLTTVWDLKRMLLKLSENKKNKMAKSVLEVIG